MKIKKRKKTEIGKSTAFWRGFPRRLLQRLATCVDQVAQVERGEDHPPPSSRMHRAVVRAGSRLDMTLAFSCILGALIRYGICFCPSTAPASAGAAGAQTQPGEKKQRRQSF